MTEQDNKMPTDKLNQWWQTKTKHMDSFIFQSIQLDYNGKKPIDIAKQRFDSEPKVDYIIFTPLKSSRENYPLVAFRTDDGNVKLSALSESEIKTLVSLKTKKELKSTNIEADQDLEPAAGLNRNVVARDFRCKLPKDYQITML